MNYLQNKLKTICSVIKWILIGVLIGSVGGLIGTVFHICLEYVTAFRQNNYYIIILLPFGGLVIAFMYNAFSSKGNIDMKRIFEAIKNNKDIPIVMIPLIFLGTLITHMLGGSSGREGAALQLGGSMGYNLGKALKQDTDNINMIVTAGMSSVFSALFGTPITATVFALEVSGVNLFNYRGILLGIISSITAFFISQSIGVDAVRFNISPGFGLHSDVVLKVIVLAVLCAGVCIIFALSIHKMEFLMNKYIVNSYIRAMIGGFLIVILTFVLRTTDYNGAGMDVIERAISGEVKYAAFLMKIIFTAITVSAGFKGGEIVPTFFIGSTFGCFASGPLGLNKGFGASLGLIALFSGMTKCPIAAFFLALEVFGAKSIPLFLIVIIISYVLSGNFGLYENKKNYSKELFRKGIALRN